MRKDSELILVSRLVTRAAALSLLIGTGFVESCLAADGGPRRTPIEHLVVIFQENVSFDHYFATYPDALNPPGAPQFRARGDTPSVNGLGRLVEGMPRGVLLTQNPNAQNQANGKNAINPFRLDRSQASTCDQDHAYGDEQRAFDQGLMDAFPVSVGQGQSAFCTAQYAWGKDKGLVLGYFDGNTVTALWNYAQHFAMNDNSHGTTFGPSTIGMLNFVAGNTYPATPSAPTPKVVPNDAGPGTLVGDLDPTGDVCSKGTTIRAGGKSVGDLLNAQNVTWGAFMGGFDLTVKNSDGSTGCDRQSPATPANGRPVNDYSPHHAFFQYFASTINPNHTRPSAVSNIGTSNDGGANHQFDLHDFFDALAVDNMPAVSFIKAVAAEDAHAGYSDPLLEQGFLVRTINAIMQSPFWPSTAVIVMYDDSDGWYDHQMSPIINPSGLKNTAFPSNGDQLNGPGRCGSGKPLSGIQGRCGYGPRLPFIVISQFAKNNFVDHTLIDQTSVLRFIEDNWNTGSIGGGSFDAVAGPLSNMFDFEGRGGSERRLLLDEATGQPR